MLANIFAEVQFSAAMTLQAKLPFYIFYTAVFLCVFGARCEGKDLITPVLIFELRMPQSQNTDTNTRIDLAVKGQGEDGTFLWACKQRREGTWLVFQRDFLLGDEPSSKRALIVSPFISGPTNIDEQVFLLSIRRHPKPADFSAWQRPNYMANNAGWAIIYGLKIKAISTNVPANCFELRYKVEKQDLGPDTN